jgi:holo-[acyl-carrier protein] synthase
MRVIGVGTEIVECLRIAQLIERHQDLFLSRVFAAAEIQFCSARAAATQHFAAHWAAKQAVLKTLGISWVPGVLWTDLEIVRAAGSAPAVALGGLAAQVAEERGIERFVVSLAHCRTHATAYVLAVSDEDGATSRQANGV